MAALKGMQGQQYLVERGLCGLVIGNKLRQSRRMAARGRPTRASAQYRRVGIGRTKGLRPQSRAATSAKMSAFAWHSRLNSALMRLS